MEVIMWLLRVENKHKSQGGLILASKNRPTVKVTYECVSCFPCSLDYKRLNAFLYKAEKWRYIESAV